MSITTAHRQEVSIADEMFATGLRTRGAGARNVEHFLGSREGAIGRSERSYAVHRGLEFWTASEREQLHALADGLGLDFEEVALFNLLPSLTRDDDCSVYGALGSATRSGLTVFGKNSDKQGDDSLVGDGYRFHREINVLVDYLTDSGLHVLGMAAAGKLGLKFSVNSAGVAGGTNYAHTVEEQRLLERGALSVGDQLAQDRAMLLRRGMEHANARDAARDVLGTVLDSPMATPGNLEFADSQSGYVVESSYSETALVSYADGVLARTNRFESLDHLNGVTESSDRRYARIQELLGERLGDVVPEDLETLSRDHANGPSSLSICTHGSGHGSRTMGAMVVSYDAPLAAPNYAFAIGSPCRAWTSPAGVVRGTLTVDGDPLPEPFLDGTAWTEHYIADDISV